HRDARLDGKVPAQRDDVERRIVERAVENEAAGIDAQALAVRARGAVDGVKHASAGKTCGAVAHAHAAAQAGVETSADEGQPFAEIELDVDNERYVRRAQRVGRA